MNIISDKLNAVREKIAAVAADAGRDSQEVRLVAVSKTFPAADIEAAYHCGQRVFGENRVQELETKVPALPGDIEWHLIGHLQSNKAAKAVALADYIHAVDSEKLIKRIDRAAAELERCPKILLEVNVSGEESKFGAAEDEVFALAEAALKCEHLELKGLMTMAPFGAAEKELHDIFSRLRLLRDKLEGNYKQPLPELSMGMSSDFVPAIEEGATLVRIGTAIFGGRDYQ